MQRGKGQALDKAFSSKGLEKKIISLIEEAEARGGVERFAVVHAADPSRAERFCTLITAVLGKKAEFITTISPIVGMHSGKGAVAVGIIEAADDGEASSSSEG